MKILKVLTIVLAVFLSLLFSVNKISAQSACSSTTDCQNLINTLQGKISDLKGQENTLSNQIAVMNSQIQLTQARIDATQAQIISLEEDISSTADKIGSLNNTFANLSRVFYNRIRKSYEVASQNPLQSLLASGTISNFVKREEYLQIAEANDRQMAFDTVQAKNDYINQKQILETKKAEVVALQTQLQSYTDQLSSQKSSKQTLLSETQGSEANYQNLLSQAKAQIAAFAGYVTSQGGLTLINADSSWPSDYYSQRDVRWGNVNIGGYYSSPSNVTTIGESGCLISSVAMVLSKRGNSQTRLTIGTNGSYFFDANFGWGPLEGLGFNTPVRSTDTSIIDSSLAQGKWVIVGLSYTDNVYSNPFHFVVITSKNGGDYNLYDPWRGPNVSLNSNYPSDYITEIITY